MIKANELRIGNWIATKIIGNVGNLIENIILREENVLVRSLNKEGINLCFDMQKGILPELYFEDCNPIPLTPEIMKSAGFVHDEENEYYRLEDFILKDDFTSLYCPGEFGSMENSFFVNCTYLHQLQNLYFALEYEELEINL